MKSFFALPLRRLPALLLAALALALTLTARAENLLPTNAPDAGPEVKAADATTQDLVRAYLQIQEQLHTTQMTLERNRQEAEEIAGRNALAFGERLNFMEKSFGAQRAAEVKTLFLLAGFIAGTAFLTVLLVAWLQARALRRMSEIAQTWAAHQPLALAGGTDPRLLGHAAAEANTRLTATIERLEKRLRELEVPAPGATALPAPNGAGGAVEALLAQGQSLLNHGQAAAATKCFDEALGLNPQHTEVLVKKGAALEKMAKLEEAIACYDRAIAADRTLTIAYLYKGGVFNRLERYNEALVCYEQALRTQEKGAAT